MILWEEKKKKYDEAGRLYISTSEEEIQNINALVDRVQEACRGYAFQKYGSDRVKLVEILQRLRIEQELDLTRPVYEFMNGVFFARDKKDQKIAFVWISHDNFENEIETMTLKNTELATWKKVIKGDLVYYEGSPFEM